MRRSRAKRSAPMTVLAGAALFALCSAAAPGAVDIEIVRLDGSGLTAVLQRAGAELAAQTDDGPVSLAWSDLRSVRVLAPSAEDAAAAPWRVELTDGGRLAVDFVATDSARLGVRTRLGGRHEVALQALRAVVAAELAPDVARRWKEIKQSEADADVALVQKAGDETLVLRGVAQAVDADGLRFAWNERTLTLPWQRIAGVRFAQPLQPRGATMWRLIGDDVICGEPLAGGAETAQIRSASLGVVAVPLARVVRIDCRSTRMTYLSQIEPAAYECAPLVGKSWGFGRDENLAGDPIRLGGRTYARGVVLHSRARLSYELAGRYVDLTARVGIVDEMQDRGAAVARVIADGDVLWEQAVRGGRPPIDVHVSVRGVQTLTLEADYGADLDLSDQVAFAEAGVIRSQ